MLAHLLNKRILFEKNNNNSKNSFGTPDKTWISYGYTFATIKYTGGDTEFNDEFGVLAYTNTEFTIRYNPIIDYNFRIKYNNQYYRILHIEIIGNNEGLRLRTIKFEDES